MTFARYIAGLALMGACVLGACSDSPPDYAAMEDAEFFEAIGEDFVDYLEQAREVDSEKDATQFAEEFSAFMRIAETSYEAREDAADTADKRRAFQELEDELNTIVDATEETGTSIEDEMERIMTAYPSVKTTLENIR